MSEGLHSGVHPDLDALNAFVEGALPEHERVECLTHLADCTQCRAVVFLAQKGAEIEEPIAVAEAPNLFWQKLLRPRAAVPVAATVIVLFSLALYRMIRHTEQHPLVTTDTRIPVKTAEATKVAEHTPEVPTARARAANPRPLLKEGEKAPESPPLAPAPGPPPAATPAPPPPPPTAGTTQVAALGGIAGTILDPAGAAIASARVELKNAATGTIYSSASDATGQYSIAALAPGRYDLSVTVPGFKKFTRSGIEVQPQEVARLDSALQVGAAAESVSVTSEAVLLKTESDGRSNNVPVNSLNDLPLFNPAGAAYTLPDKSAPASVAVKDELVVAADSAGALLVSTNAGKTWTRVKPAWKGKVMGVVVNANAMFELTTDPMSTWVSKDGRIWSENRASR